MLQPPPLKLLRLQLEKLYNWNVLCITSIGRYWFTICGDVLSNLLTFQHRVHHHSANDCNKELNFTVKYFILTILAFTLSDLVLILDILVTGLAVVPCPLHLHAVAGNEEADSVGWNL